MSCLRGRSRANGIPVNQDDHRLLSPNFKAKKGFESVPRLEQLRLLCGTCTMGCGGRVGFPVAVLNGLAIACLVQVPGSFTAIPGPSRRTGSCYPVPLH